MSTKNIALNFEVYKKLARFRGESESFSKAIDRLLGKAQTTHTGSDILERLSSFASLTGKDADIMLGVVREDRQAEGWQNSDLP